MVIVDVAVAFENRYEAFERIRHEKIRKYEPIANHFRMRGWDVKLDAVVVGALGSWDPANEPALKALRISPRYCKMMRRFIVSDTIRWSRDMYVEHVTGRRQYIVPTDPLQLPGAIDPMELFPPPERLPNDDPAAERVGRTVHEPMDGVALLPPNNLAVVLENDPVLELENNPAHELENPTETTLSPGLTFPDSNRLIESPLTEHGVVEELMQSLVAEQDLVTSTGTVLLPPSLSPSNFD
jgi:hypothetical protein